MPNELPMTTIGFMTANYVAREVGYAMHGWGHGDRATNEAFAPLATYAEKLDELLGRIAALGFRAVDVWGAHLSPDWASDQHVEIAVDTLRRQGLTVTSYATWIGPSNVERSCELALALGTSLIGGGFSGDPQLLAPVLEKVAAGGDQFGATVDTGWWGTQGYDAARAIEELGDRVLHVHLKDVVAVGEPHETCRWGEGVVPVEECVQTLRRLRYGGAIAVEHEPETFDPTDDIRAMREQLEAWLA